MPRQRLQAGAASERRAARRLNDVPTSRSGGWLIPDRSKQTPPVVQAGIYTRISWDAEDPQQASSARGLGQLPAGDAGGIRGLRDEAWGLR